MAAVTLRAYGRDPMSWLRHGVIGGIVAGVIFMLYEILMAAWLMGLHGVLVPLRMVGAIVLGQGALDPSYSATLASVGGAIVHMLLSALFGALFGAILVGAVQLWPSLRRSTPASLLLASAYGLVLWLINFYIIAPRAGFSWFPDRSQPLVQFTAHTFCYGTVLGLYFYRIAGTRARVATQGLPVDRPERIRRAG